jgi:type II secretory pathway pseudopilin PulG
MEVLLAVVLFGAAVAIVTVAFNSSLESLERQKRSAQALNMAASVMAEVQLGLRPAVSDGARPFEAPWKDWTWETSITPMENATGGLNGLSTLEVVVRLQKSTIVQRLAQVVKPPASPATNAVIANQGI